MKPVRHYFICGVRRLMEIPGQGSPGPQSWFDIAVAIIVSLFGFIFLSYRSRVEAMEKEIVLLKTLLPTYVTRDELQRYLDQLREDRSRMHDENKGLLKNLDDNVN